MGWGGGTVDVLDRTSYVIVVDVALKVLVWDGVGDLLKFLIRRLTLLMLKVLCWVGVGDQLTFLIGRLTWLMLR